MKDRDLDSAAQRMTGFLRKIRPYGPQAHVAICAWGPCTCQPRKGSKYCTDEHRKKTARQRYRLRQISQD